MTLFRIVFSSGSILRSVMLLKGTERQKQKDTVVLSGFVEILFSNDYKML